LPLDPVTPLKFEAERSLRSHGVALGSPYIIPPASVEQSTLLHQPPMRATSVKSISSVVTSTTSWQPSLGGYFSDVAPVAANLKPDRGSSSSPEPVENQDAVSTAGPVFQPPVPLRRSVRIQKIKNKSKEFNPASIDYKARPPTKATRKNVCITLLLYECPLIYLW
jgi:hypothetical protein